ncbi:hypothetical protein K3757_13210 [Sulfitobacter sp. S223]|uniref:hypothetical protein n=1 Tax=Sulfitobacter sp. S223 TaxID=2867023 RepID=UPI0021A83AEB|nr:hypothetical protein [Sulfitobacter sp. S223]UWR25415.1 hypothetical protein K3757_13210 [Sulfitobacter sp. S223]
MSPVFTVTIKIVVASHSAGVIHAACQKLTALGSSVFLIDMVPYSYTRKVIGEIHHGARSCAFTMLLLRQRSQGRIE